MGLVKPWILLRWLARYTHGVDSSQSYSVNNPGPVVAASLETVRLTVPWPHWDLHFHGPCESQAPFPWVGVLPGSQVLPASPCVQLQACWRTWPLLPAR